MSQTQDSETAVKGITNGIDSFDRAVANHEITAYDAVFASGSIGFATNLDWYKKTTPVAYSFDFETRTGSITSTRASEETWELVFSAPDTPGKTLTLSASGGFQVFSFPTNLEKRQFRISSGIGDEYLNSFEMRYYSLSNARLVPESEIRLVKIEGESGLLYDALTIRNVLSKKSLHGSGTTIDTLEKAILTFEKNGKEMKMTVSR